MKKIVSLLLAMCLLLAAVPALADKELNLDNMSDTSLVTLTVSSDMDNFTVIIPSTIAFDATQQHSETTIKLNAGWKLIAHDKLKVVFGGAAHGIGSNVAGNKKNNLSLYGNWNFTLESGEGNTVKYNISRGKLTTVYYDEKPVVAGAQLIYVTKTTSSTTSEKSCTLYFDLYSIPTECVYTDTITFEIVLE